MLLEQPPLPFHTDLSPWQGISDRDLVYQTLQVSRPKHCVSLRSKGSHSLS